MKATKELIQDLSGKSVRSTDDLTDGIAIRKALSKADPEYFEETRADAQERDPTRKVKKTVELIEKYFSEKMGREAPKDVVDAEKVVKDRDENELFKLTDLVVGVALLGKNKESTKKTVEKLGEKSQKALEKVVDCIDEGLSRKRSKEEKEKATN